MNNIHTEKFKIMKHYVEAYKPNSRDIDFTCYFFFVTAIGRLQTER